MNCFGDSRTATFTGYTYGYCQQVASLVGVSTPTNYGVSGTLVADATSAVFNNISAPSPTTLNSFSIGVNDATNGAIGAYESTFNSIWNAAITWMGIPAASKYAEPNYIAQYGSLPPGWTADTTYSQVTGFQATANGATISIPYTVTANQTQQPVVWYECITGDAGTFTVADTGWYSVATPYTTAPVVAIKTAGTPSGKSVCSIVSAVPNRVAGTYAMTIVKTNTSGSVHILGVGVTPGDNATRSTPFVLAWDIYRLRLGLDDPAVQTINADIRNDVSLLIQAGINVGLVNTQNRVFGTTGPVGTDFSDGSATSRPDCGYVFTGQYIHGCQAVQNELLLAAQDPFFTPNAVPPQNNYGPIQSNQITQPDPNGYISSSGSIQQSGANYFTGANFLSGTNYISQYYGDQTGTNLIQQPSSSGQIAITSQLPGAAQILSGANIAYVGGACNTGSITYSPANANNTLVVSYFSASITAPTVTDNLSGVYTLGVSNSYQPAIFYKIGSLSGITSVNVTNAGVTFEACVAEYSGVAAVGVTSTAFVGTPYSVTTMQSPNSYTVMAGNTSASTTLTATSGTIRKQGNWNSSASSYVVQDFYSSGRTATIAASASPTTSIAYVTLEFESLPNIKGNVLTLNGSGCASGAYAKADGTGCGTPAGTVTGANPTATATGTAINGSATTFMRSDAAPAIQTSSSSQPGLLAAADWSTFNGKQAAIASPSLFCQDYALPTIASGFGTSPAIYGQNPCYFVIYVGTGGTASSGVITLVAAPTQWGCSVFYENAPSASNFITYPTTLTSTSVTFSVFSDTATAGAWSSGQYLGVHCQPR
jgi:hypothetical protein